MHGLGLIKRVPTSDGVHEHEAISLAYILHGGGEGGHIIHLLELLTSSEGSVTTLDHIRAKEWCKRNCSHSIAFISGVICKLCQH